MVKDVRMSASEVAIFASKRFSKGDREFEYIMQRQPSPSRWKDVFCSGSGTAGQGVTQSAAFCFATNDS